MNREDKIKKHLIKEASQRVSIAKMNSKNSGMEDEQLKQYLTKEAYDRLSKLKLSNIIQEASLDKESMALSSGYRALRTATTNLQWKYPNIGKKSAAIMRAIEESFNTYRKGRVGGSGTSHPIQSGLYWDPIKVGEIPDDGSDGPQLSSEPLATFVMRFSYSRHILPNQNSEGYQDVMNTISAVDNFFASNNINFRIQDFIRDLEASNVPLYSYFHASDLGEDRGGAITNDEISKFLPSELYKMRTNPRDPNTAAGISSNKWFGPHAVTVIREKKPIRMTSSHRADMSIPNEAVDGLNWDSELLRAIANKVQQGYALDRISLERDLQMEKEKVRSTTKAEDTSILDSSYKNRLKNIIDEFKKGLEIQYMENVDPKKLRTTAKPKHEYHWGLERKDGKIGYRVGLATTGAKRNRKSNLNFDDLKLLLKNITLEASTVIPQMRGEKSADFEQDYMSFAQIERKNYNTPPDGFFVKDRSIVFSSNGLDSNPWEKGSRMLLVPSIKKLPDSKQGPGKLIYDSDNANMGRNQVTKNWYLAPRGGERIPALSNIVTTWGPKADAAIRSLAGSKTSFQNRNADRAWSLISSNRTNADSTWDVIQKYSGNWDKFDKEVLSVPLATAIDCYYKNAPQLKFSQQNINLFNELKGGSPLNVEEHARFANRIHQMAQHLKGDPLIGPILAEYPDNIDPRGFLKNMFEACRNNIPAANGLLAAIIEYQRSGNWDTLVSYMQNNGYIEEKSTDRETKMDQAGFDSWSKYGYPLGKMMDFVSCLVYASSGEVYERKSRKETVHDEVFGRNYSTSSGKGNGGQVMIGMRYAYNAGEVADINTEEGKQVIDMINEERNRRHDAYKIKGPTYRKSSNWENLGEKVVNINGKLVSVGEHQPLPQGATPPEYTSVKVIKVIENLEFFIGHAGSEDGWLKQMESGTDWQALLSSFKQRYPTLQGMLDVLISPIQARFDLLEVNAKKAIDNVRRRLEEELSSSPDAPSGKISVEVELQQQRSGTSILSTNSIADQTKVLQDKTESDKTKDPNENLEISAGDTEQPNTPEPVQPTVPTSPVSPNVPNTAPEISDTTQTGPTETMEELDKQPPIKPTTPVTQPQQMPKPMEENPRFVGKRKSPRNLVRRSPVRGITNRSSVITRLEKIANELDRRGITLLSDKVDIILKRITEC